MFYVKYTVAGFGEQKAGPYSAEDVQYQLTDIAGYEGVSNAYICSAEEEKSDLDKMKEAFSG